MIIAGPCSIETPEQLDKTVSGLVDQGVRIIRGGVWKPRTRPGNFEGVGAIALPWIKEVKEKYGVKFAIEVANPNHVEQALEAGAHEVLADEMTQQVKASLSAEQAVYLAAR